MIMTLDRRKCHHCPKEQYAMLGLFCESLMSKSKYEGLLKSMNRVAEVTKGTGAEHMTRVTTITPSDDQDSKHLYGLASQ